MALSEVGEHYSVAQQQVQELRERRVQLCDIHLVRYSRQYGRKPVRLNVNKFKCCRTLQGYTGKIYALDWSYLESTRIVSASQDGRPIVWNAVSSQKTHAIRLACAWVTTAAFSPVGTAVACGGFDNVCSIFHLSSLSDKDGNLPVSHTLMAIRVTSHVGTMCPITKPIFSPAPETKHAFYGMLKPTSAYILLEEILHLEIMVTS